MKKTSINYSFDQFCQIIARKREWAELSSEEQKSFEWVFIHQQDFMDMCSAIFLNQRFYTKEEGELFWKLSQGKMVSEDDMIIAFRFVKEHRLWNPFQVLYGDDFLILPYNSMFSTRRFDYEHRSHLNNSLKDIENNLIAGIRIARLIETFIRIPQITQQYSIAIKKSIIHQAKTYKLAFNPETNAFTVEYGMGLDTRYYPDIDVLGSYIRRDINAYRSFIRQSIPPLRAKEIIEPIRAMECNNNTPKSHTAAFIFPYRFSINKLQNFKLSGRGFPFEFK